MEEYTDKIKKLTKYNISDVLTSVHKDEDGNYHAVEGGLQDGDMMIICAAIASRKIKRHVQMHKWLFLMWRMYTALSNV